MNTPKPAYRARSIAVAHPRIDPGTQVLAGRHRERARRRIVNLVFVIYWLLIFEGALRKWIFPDAFQVLFFIRDPFVLLTYGLAVLKPRPLPGRHWLAAWLMLGVGALLVGLAHLWMGDVDLVILGYGWRNYFYYIPLAFVIGANFRQEDLERLIRQTLLVTVPLAVLVFLQFSSPSNALINQGAIEGGLYQPGVVRDIVRTYGTFTSSAGQSPFIGSLVAMILAVWILPQEQRPIQGIVLWAASGAVLTSLAVSGSRSAFALSALVFLAAMVGGLVSSQEKMRARTIFVVLLLGFAATLLIPTVFSDAFGAIAERSADSYRSESEIYAFGTIGRALAPFGSFTQLIPDTPLFGYGLGLFGNAYGTLSLSLLRLGTHAEDDWSRNIAELGPALGLLYICLRIALVVWLAKGAIAATRRSNNPLPVLLIGFVGVILLYGQITGNGTVNGYGWLFAGFCMAANQIGQDLSRQDDSGNQR